MHFEIHLVKLYNYFISFKTVAYLNKDLFPDLELVSQPTIAQYGIFQDLP